MTKEEFKETKSLELWDQMINNENIKEELDSCGIKDFDFLMSQYMIKDDVAGTPPFLKSFVMKNLETFASLKAHYLPEDHISIQISYCGRNIMGWSCLPKEGEAGYLLSSIYRSFGDLLARDCESGFYVAAVDKDDPKSESYREYLRGATSISSYSQIYARFSLAAAYCGADLVNKALIAADCLNLDELRELAEQDEFVDQDIV